MTTVPRKEDRRKERTRQLLRDAMMELIVEKGYEDINIQDITDRANVARPTFYLHFSDKKDLLLSSLREIYDALSKGYLPKTRETVLNFSQAPEIVDKTDFQHVAEHAEFYRTMLSDKGALPFILMVMDYLRGMMENEGFPCMVPKAAVSRMPQGAIAAYLAGAQVGLAYWWLYDNKQQFSPQEISQIMFFQNVFGLNWSLNLDIPAPDFQIPVSKANTE